MRITVLFGGPSNEREISLISGQAVIDGLRAAGHEVLPSDVSPKDLSGLDKPADVIFPVLHGAFGEDGQLQAILEQRKLPFVGSGSRASRLAFDKVASKTAWRSAGLPTPAWEVLASPEPTLGVPCVVKPIASGSSIDVYICKTADELAAACRTVVAKYGQAMVERFIEGVELTVGIIEDQAFPPIRIKTTREFYDYTAKYKGNFTEYLFDTSLPPDVNRACQDLAVAAHKALGCRDLSRVDIMVDAQHRPWLLEINTIPGCTPKSLLPKGAKAAGIEFPALVDRLARVAAARGGNGRG